MSLKFIRQRHLGYLKLTGPHSLKLYFCSGRRRLPGLRRKRLHWTRLEEQTLKVDRNFLFLNAPSIHIVQVTVQNLGLCHFSFPFISMVRHVKYRVGGIICNSFPIYKVGYHNSCKFLLRTRVFYHSLSYGQRSFISCSLLGNFMPSLCF